MKIVLCGYMGCGKSLIGKLLAEKTSLDFVDLDQQIECVQNQTIPKIFSEKGEIFFRKTETAVLKDCLKSKKDIILSLGGGTPCYGQNLKLIKENPQTILVYLKLGLDELTTRLFTEKLKRPLLKDIENKEDLKDYIRKHLFERRYYYLQSDHILDCSKASPKDIVEKLLKII